MKLKDKVALITGGARGIGKAVALAYAREGARLAICARTESEINETVQEIQKLKADAKAGPAMSPSRIRLKILSAMLSKSSDASTCW